MIPAIYHFITNKNIMALRPDSRSGFAAFPRETRDMVFSCIASAAKIGIDPHNNYSLDISECHDYTACIELLHEWAPVSDIAKGACEVIWSGGSFNHGWYSDSETIVDAHVTLFLRTFREGLVLRKSVRTPIDLREGVQRLWIYTNPNLADPTDHDKRSLLKLKQQLSQFTQFPHLRSVQVEISIPQECDAYFEDMTVIESISNACKCLKTRIGAGSNISLLRAWPYDIAEFEYVETYDITWMWDKPSQAQNERVLEGLATADERIRVLIAEGVNSNEERSLLEQ